MTVKQEKIKEYMALYGAECYKDNNGKIWRKTETLQRWVGGRVETFWYECMNDERPNYGEYLSVYDLDKMEFLGTYGEYLLRRKIEWLEQKQQ